MKMKSAVGYQAKGHATNRRDAMRTNGWVGLGDKTVAKHVTVMGMFSPNVQLEYAVRNPLFIVRSDTDAAEVKVATKSWGRKDEEEFLIGVTDSGWMTEELFDDFVEKICIRIRNNIPEAKRIVLYIDCAIVHISLVALTDYSKESQLQCSIYSCERDWSIAGTAEPSNHLPLPFLQRSL
jgi:hypothetical protein